MSTKNAKHKSKPFDVYLTEKPLIRAGFQELQQRWPTFKPRTMLEPGAGEAPFCDVARELFPSITTSVAVDRLAQTVSPAHVFYRDDFLVWQTARKFDFISSNFPFSLAEPFVRRSVELLTPTGMGFFLLRIAFLASRRRLPLWLRDVNLQHVTVISARPSFTSDGRTDSADYAFFAVGSGPPVKEPTFSWLSSWTPPRRRVARTTAEDVKAA